MNTTVPTNMDNIIDSRDVIARIDDLELLGAASGDEFINGDTSELDPEEAEELAALRSLAEQGEGYVPDWQYGETLIRDDYFEDYARELAEDIGAIDREAGWPAYCIDWERAANDLRIDYTELTFDGVTYWARA